MFLETFKGDPSELEGYLKEVQMVFEGNFKAISKMFSASFKGV